MSTSTVQSKLCWAALAVGSLVQAAPATLIPLEPGTYVVSSFKPCEEAPLAGVKAFDGKAFIGPHESKCTSSVMSRHGQTYQVSTKCLAHGDGSPEKPTRSLETMQISSPSSLAVMVHGEAVQYELCLKFP